MKKRIIMVAVIAIIAVLSVSASIIQIGATGRYKGSLTDIEDWKNIENYDFGADARINLGILGVGVNALYGGDFTQTHSFDAVATANLRLELGPVELSAGAGYSLYISNATGEWLINGFAVDAMDQILGKGVLVHAGAGINLGGIGIAADYRLPVASVLDICLGESDVSDLQYGKVSVSLLLNLF